MTKTGIGQKIRDFVGRREYTRAQIVIGLPEFGAQAISAALGSLCRNGYLHRRGTSRMAVYSIHQAKVVLPANGDSKVQPFRGNVFGPHLGKVPHILDPRRDSAERENLAMLIR